MAYISARYSPEKFAMICDPAIGPRLQSAHPLVAPAACPAHCARPLECVTATPRVRDFRSCLMLLVSRRGRAGYAGLRRGRQRDRHQWSKRRSCAARSPSPRGGGRARHYCQRQPGPSPSAMAVSHHWTRIHSEQALRKLCCADRLTSWFSAAADCIAMCRASQQSSAAPSQKG